MALKVKNAHQKHTHKKQASLLAHGRKGERLTVRDKEQEKAGAIGRSSNRKQGGERGKVTPNSSST